MFEYNNLTIYIAYKMSTFVIVGNYEIHIRIENLYFKNVLVFKKIQNSVRKKIKKKPVFVKYFRQQEWNKTFYR